MQMLVEGLAMGAFATMFTKSRDPLLKRLTLILCLGLFVGCQSESSESDQSDRLQIAVIPKGTTHQFWKSIHAGANKAGFENDVEIIWQGPQKEDDRQMQIQVVQNFNPEELSLARFKAIIPVSTIYTGIKSRDRHLLKAKYFNQENFPEMVFESTEVNASNKGYQLIGNLTIKSTTKSVDIKFSIEREGEESYYKGYLELDRKDYGVGKKHLLLGDLVRITLKIPVESPGI